MKASERNKLLGRRIRELRKERGLTQEQLSEKVGKTDEVISNIETGAASTRLSTLFDIADALKVSLVDFFDWVSPRKMTTEEIRQEEIISRVRKILRGEIAPSAEDLADINAALVRTRHKKAR